MATFGPGRGEHTKRTKPSGSGGARDMRSSLVLAVPATVALDERVGVRRACPGAFHRRGVDAVAAAAREVRHDGGSARHPVHIRPPPCHVLMSHWRAIARFIVRRVRCGESLHTPLPTLRIGKKTSKRVRFRIRGEPAGGLGAVTLPPVLMGGGGGGHAGHKRWRASHTHRARVPARTLDP